ncbi:MAG: SBBP repeat-containing protein, partial [Bacteroidota bacterium]|nr:SBBP repeat-containing protein [Bacteroidota bacterium]
IFKYDLKGDFINVINKRIYDINFVEDHISVARYVNNKKAFGTEIMPGDIIDFAKYLQVAPTLEAIIEKIIYPERLKMSSDGNVYALGKDIYRKNYRVGIIDPTDGHTIFIFGKSGTGEADLLWPKDIAVDTEGNIYITNYVYSKEGEKLFAVKKYDNRGNFIKSWGVWGGGNGEFKDPWAIAIDDRNGYVYVTDAFYPSWMRGTGEEHPQERVQKFTKDGKFIKKWGGNRITGVVVFPPRLLVEPDFSDPVGIAVDSKGYVYVLEDDRARVSKFDGDGKLIKRWGKPGVGQGEFRDPQAIAIDKNDNVYIADTGNDRIQKFDPNGKFLMEIR